MAEKLELLRNCLLEANRMDLGLLKAEEVKVNSNGEVVPDEGILMFDEGMSDEGISEDEGISVAIVAGFDTM
jgi:hypothetical protein